MCSVSISIYGDVVDAESGPVVRKWFLLVATIVVVATAMGVFVARSESYRFAADWAKHSPEVQGILGEVTDVGTFPRRFSVGSTSNYKYARYTLTVAGKKGTGTLYLTLRRERDTWHVVSARLNETTLLVAADSK